MLFRAHGVQERVEEQREDMTVLKRGWGKQDPVRGRGPARSTRTALLLMICAQTFGKNVNISNSRSTDVCFRPPPPP